jgi:hypothetical protein
MDDLTVVIDAIRLPGLPRIRPVSWTGGAAREPAPRQTQTWTTPADLPRSSADKRG